MIASGLSYLSMSITTHHVSHLIMVSRLAWLEVETGISGASFKRWRILFTLLASLGKYNP